MESFAISMKSLRAYLNMGLFDGYNTLLTKVNGKEIPYMIKKRTVELLINSWSL